MFEIISCHTGTKKVNLKYDESGSCRHCTIQLSPLLSSPLGAAIFLLNGRVPAATKLLADLPYVQNRWLFGALFSTDESGAS
jgi:hypothetical protein